MLGVGVIGLVVGFLGGLFGKGGSAIATPLLQLAGVPAFSAVASPLPATIPSTLMATIAYLRSGLYDRKVVVATVVAGVPLTCVGAWLSSAVGGLALLLLSNLVVAGLGLSFLVAPTHAEAAPAVARDRTRLALVVGGGVGFLSGLLANSGGFLFAPLYVRVLKLPLKVAFACSLVASAALALPGTVVHATLGHVDWKVVAVFAAGSVPCAYLGARVAIASRVAVLERVFGVALLIIGGLGVADSLGFGPSRWLHLG